MKITLPTEKPFLRLARASAFPDSGVAAGTERYSWFLFAVPGDTFQGMVYWRARLGGAGFLPNGLLLSCCKKEGLETLKDL